MKNLNSQMSLKNDKLSEELTDANNALDKYQQDKKVSSTNKDKNNSNSNNADKDTLLSLT